MIQREWERKKMTNDVRLKRISVYMLFGSWKLLANSYAYYSKVNLKSQNGSSKEQSNNQKIIKQNEYKEQQQQITTSGRNQHWS